ncbi:MAG: tRNA uridine-5-carboxymethylaminomethyl(34) synthesis GTPase MnmE, partial [Oscillospiraceae bacterium]|nr:tRNA uridine-5-carboxymethylaminomethyl(34) synthesis GTPase MnmE [Candidatus Equicaccousia limihippi]
VENGEIIDEVIATVFKAPHSYTGENTVELSCHGGQFVTSRVLDAVYNAGAVPAQAGEFSFRAYLNGKIDLSNAESIMGIIGAKGQKAMEIALRNKDGAVSKEIDKITDRLLNLTAKIAVFCDYPDDESMGIDQNEFINEIQNCKQSVQTLLNNYENGRLLQSGILTVIAGKPNVGKSTLINLLAGEQVAIVTPVAGTTRDIIETEINLGGLYLRLADTAGIRETGDTVEKIGVDLAKKKMEQSDIILYLTEAGAAVTEKEKADLKKYRDKIIAVINKTDLNSPDTSYFDKQNITAVCISAKTGEGKDLLCQAISQKTGILNISPQTVVLQSARQKEAAKSALDALIKAEDALISGLTPDCYGVWLDEALAKLLEITGKRVQIEVANRVFRDFCVGK